MFEERLKNLIKKEGLTLEQVGKSIGVTGSAISMMLRGDRKPSYEALQGLCKTLKTTPNYLLGFEDEISEQDRAILAAIKSVAANTQNENKSQDNPIQKQLPEKAR